MSDAAPPLAARASERASRSATRAQPSDAPAEAEIALPAGRVRVAYEGDVVLSAGSPLVAYRFSRRNAARRLVAMVVWLPALLLVGICVIGFAIFPP